GLTHNMFDASLFLGICDKIVPGMVIGALRFGHLPALFVPAGPMASGIPNKQKAAKRQEFARGKIDKEEMLDVELASYHSAGTCTFYGTANSNQMLMEMLGVQLPNSSFVHPHSDLRKALNQEIVRIAVDNTQASGNYRPLYEIVTEKSLVNAIVGLLATGGSTNHCLHLIAIAKAAGIDLHLEDLDELSTAVPLLARVYPNGLADVNHFHAAGGISFLVKELRKQGFLNEDVSNILGQGLDYFCNTPELNDQGELVWKAINEVSGDEEVLRPVANPFSSNGGLRLLDGNLGKAIIKISAIKEEHYIVEAPCKIFHSQDEFIESFNKGELFQDLVAVLRFQGPAAIGMPELHKLTPLLGIVQDQGRQVALVTDGRMSGASGKVPAAIHCSPEALKGGMLAKLQDGDVIRLDATQGVLTCLVDDTELAAREPAHFEPEATNLGRDLFEIFRVNVSNSEEGAAVF
ncbi:MAG: phosphogluconate dehydratase, partial [Gammaproteobacteria bacterium]|nr:phosphogluconate dehydratase [Gammaproteobacteria bacterium]